MIVFGYQFWYTHIQLTTESSSSKKTISSIKTQDIDPSKCVEVRTVKTVHGVYTAVFIGKSMNNLPETMPEYCNEPLQRMIFKVKEDGGVDDVYNKNFNLAYASAIADVEIRTIGNFDYVYTKTQEFHNFRDPLNYSLTKISDYSYPYLLSVEVDSQNAPGDISFSYAGKTYSIRPVLNTLCEKEKVVPVEFFQVTGSDSLALYQSSTPIDIVCESFFVGGEEEYVYEIGAPDIRIEDINKFTFSYGTKEIYVNVSENDIYLYE